MSKFLYVLLLLLLASCSNSASNVLPTKHVAAKTTSTQPKASPLAIGYNEVKWLEWDDVSLIRAKLKSRPIAVFFYDDSCQFCDMMEATTFQDPDIISILNKNFVPVKARGEDFPNAMETLFGAHNYPALAFLAPDGTLLAAVSGYVSPSSYKQALQIIVKANEPDHFSEAPSDSMQSRPQ